MSALCVLLGLYLFDALLAFFLRAVGAESFYEVTIFELTTGS